MGKGVITGVEVCLNRWMAMGKGTWDAEVPN